MQGGQKSHYDTSAPLPVFCHSKTRIPLTNPQKRRAGLVCSVIFLLLKSSSVRENTDLPESSSLSFLQHTQSRRPKMGSRFAFFFSPFPPPTPPQAPFQLHTRQERTERGTQPERTEQRPAEPRAPSSRALRATPRRPQAPRLPPQPPRPPAPLTPCSSPPHARPTPAASRRLPAPRRAGLTRQPAGLVRFGDGGGFAV